MALSLASNLNFEAIIVESHFQICANLRSDLEFASPCYIKSIISDSLALLADSLSVSVYWIPRQCNYASHSLARWSFDCNFFGSFDVNNNPSCFVLVVSRRSKTDGSCRIQVRSIGFAGQSVRWLKRVIFLNGLRVGSSWPVFFKQIFFFFFEIDAIYQLFMSSLIVIKFSLVILLLITTKHFIPKCGATLIPAF